MQADQNIQIAKERWHGLTALRAVAMLLGITLHAAVPYLSLPMKGLNWVCQETPSLICDITFWWVHAWRLPLFFFLAGFFARLTSERHGITGFAKHRFRRLVIPYLAACYTIGPAIYVVFAIGWYLTGQCSFEQMMPHIPFPPELQENAFGPAHLWFLQDLIILSIVYLYLSLTVSSGSTGTREVHDIGPVKWWIPFVAAIPCGLLLWSDLSPLMEFNNTFLADPARLLYYSTFFMGGIAAYHNREWFLEAVRFYRIHLLLSLPFCVLFMWLMQTDLLEIQSLFGRLAIGLVSATIAWLAIYGLIGWFVYRVRSEHPAVQYLADSSYWMYLCHLPIVAALHLCLHWVDMPSVLKFVVVSCGTTLIGLSSYHLFVRYTIFGTYLHGSKDKAGTASAAESTSMGKAVIALLDD